MKEGEEGQKRDGSVRVFKLSFPADFMFFSWIDSILNEWKEYQINNIW